MMRLRAFVAAAVFLWQAPAAANGTAPTGDPAIAREQLKIGYALAEDGKCDQALPHLRESLRLDPKAITLINLADCEEKVGYLSDAMAHWVEARARAEREGARAIAEEAEQRATALEPRLPRLTIVLAPTAPEDATVERDGILLGRPSLGIPLPMNPGEHTIVVKAKGRPDRAVSVRLAEGEAKRIEVDAASEPIAPGPAAPSQPGAAGRAPSPAMFAGFAVAGAALAAGTVTGLLALDAASEAKAKCPDLACDQAALDEVEAGRTMGTISTVAFAVAGVGALVGVYGLLWGGKRAAADAASVSVSFAPSSVGVRGRF